MKILLVSAYPEAGSFGGQLLSRLSAELRARGDGVTVSDLPRMKFPAIIDRRQFGRGRGFFDVQAAQDKAQRAGTVHNAVAAEQEKVKRADMIVMLAPIYWASPPALLRGWMEQVFAPGFAYERGKIFEAGLLKGRGALFVATHSGKLGAATDAGARARMQELLAPLEDRPLRYSGLRTLPCVSLCPPDYRDGAAREAALAATVKEIMARLDTPSPGARHVFPLVSINGRPGVGKKTVAELLAPYINARVVDNHAILNVGTVAAGRSTPGYYRINRAVRAAVFAELAEELTKRPVVLTNALVEQVDEHHEIAAEIAMLARKAGAPLYNFILTADFNENARRLQSPERDKHMKLTDAGKLAALYRDFSLIVPDGAKTVDTTGKPAICTARIIRDSLPEVEP